MKEEKNSFMELLFTLFGIIGICLFISAVGIFTMNQFQKQRVYYMECSSVEKECSILNLESDKKMIVEWRD